MKGRKIVGVCLCMTLFATFASNSFIYANEKSLLDESSIDDSVDIDNQAQPEVTEEKFGNTKEQVENIEDSIDDTKKQAQISLHSLPLDVTPDIWDGSADTSWFTGDKSVYEITTPEQLAGLAALVEGGNSMTGMTFKLMNDLYLNDDADALNKTWPMIGRSTAKSFDGSIDGQNHTVHNVYVNETSLKFIGFLGQTTNREPLKNIVITGSINGSNDAGVQCGVIGHIADDVVLENITNKASITGKRAAGIVPECDTIIINNCINEGVITGDSDGAAGILGYSYRKSTITNCHNKGAVKSKGRVGGIVGYSGMISIESSSNIGNISADGYAVGGIIGETIGDNTNVLINNCTNAANIYAWGDAGGIAGKNSGIIRNSKNLSGKVETYFYNAGGVVGQLTQQPTQTNTDKYGQIINCTNYANVSASVGSGEDKYLFASGGIVGYADKAGKIEQCVNKGTIWGIHKAGGIVGYIHPNSADVILNCDNEGNVEANDYVGGIVGHNEGLTKIQLSSNIANMTGNGFNVGGLVGYNSKGSISDSTSSGDIYSWGTAGGIVGYNQATVTNCQNLGGKVEAYFNVAGGIVGYQSSASTVLDEFGEILNCTNKAHVEAGIGNDVSNAKQVGGIVGGLHRGKRISQCKNMGTVKGIDHAGGIVGASIDVKGGSIDHCENLGGVSAIQYFGGIIGPNDGAMNISNSINKGTLTMLHDSRVVGKTMGGIAAKMPANSSVKDCINEGQITSYGNWTGGIVGSNYAPITNCKNSGKIQIDTIDVNDNTQYMQLGAIAGWSNANITDCINDGIIQVALASNYAITNNQYITYNVGGIAGRVNNATVSNCYNNASISGIRNTITQKGTQFYQFGGIVGYNSGTTIQYSHNKGMVEVKDTSNDTVNNQIFVGGIASLSYNDSNIIQSSNTGDLHTNVKNGYLGGIAAKADNTDITDSFAVCDLYADGNDVVFMAGVTIFFFSENNTYKMKNVYFAGEMIVKNPQHEKNAYLSAMYGGSPDPSTIQNVFFDGDVLTKNASVSGPERKLHTFEMSGTNMKKNTTQLDYDNTWMMKEDYQDTTSKYRFYPTLKSDPDQLNNAYTYYKVTINNDPRYVVSIDENFDPDGVVLEHKNFEFTLNMKDAYQSLHYKVLDNNAEIAPIKDQTYKLSDIQVDHTITVVFELLEPTVVFPDEIIVHYGQSLKDAKYSFQGDGTMRFDNPEKRLTVKESGQKQKMVFEATDSLIYKNVEKEVVVKVLPIQPSVPKAIYVRYQSDFKLSQVALPRGWTWNNENQLVQEGTHKYLASFHDDDGNYKDVDNVNITINMEKKLVEDVVETGESTGFAIYILCFGSAGLALISIRRKLSNL